MGIQKGLQNGIQNEIQKGIEKGSRRGSRGGSKRKFKIMGMLLTKSYYYFEIQIFKYEHVLFSNMSRFVTPPQKRFSE